MTGGVGGGKGCHNQVNVGDAKLSKTGVFIAGLLRAFNMLMCFAILQGERYRAFKV